MRRVLADAGPDLVAYADRVVRPDGTTGIYPWVEGPDLVRVLMLLPDGTIPIAQQHHYLVGPMWQLPGGQVDPVHDQAPGTGRPDPYLAALRELEEETGIIPTELVHWVRPEPIPGLTTASVTIYVGSQVSRTVPPRPEPGEAGSMEILRVSVHDAAQAVTDGRMRCAASAAAVIAAAAGEFDQGPAGHDRVHLLNHQPWSPGRIGIP